jgi:2-polyprenyl-6-methoxyphenol hydroxylase-like FAD-dependent oxidoreductase
MGNVGGYSRVALPDLPAGTYKMVFGKRAFFGYVVSPAGEVWWFANPPRATELSRAELQATPQEWKEHLIGLFEGDAGPALEIIRKTHVLAVTNQHDLPRVPVWSRGPMIIIGDAAHAASPTSGQGASLAIEDAIVLAQCLRDIPDQSAAFAAFERLRRPRVERVVAWAARMNQTKIPGRFGRVLRDAMMPFILKAVAKKPQSWLFDYQIDWERRLDVGARAA